MRNLFALLLTITLLIFSGCSERTEPMAADHNAQPSPAADSKPKVTQAREQQAQGDTDKFAQLASVYEATPAQATTTAFERKIIRNAELTLETEAPADGQRRIAAIAEALGGYIVTSEFKQNAASSKPSESVNVVARVPSPQFNAAVEQILSTGKEIHKKISGQDVSEEYLDIEARIRSKKALEAQFLEIMKQARKVSDALEVQSQLADVRTEIERLEGRRRFLENQSALSTITVSLQLPAPVVATTSTSFGQEIKQAFGTAVDTAAVIVLFLIRAVIVLTPFALIFGVPGWLIWRLVRRRTPLQDEPASVESR